MVSKSTMRSKGIVATVRSTVIVGTVWSKVIVVAMWRKTRQTEAHKVNSSLAPRRTERWTTLHHRQRSSPDSGIWFEAHTVQNECAAHLEPCLGL
jgi:hypothetical protein